MSGSILLRVENLKKYFLISGGFFSKSRKVIHALDGVSFELARGDTMGIVGESGSGKTTLARTILGLIKPTSGAVYFEGMNIFKISKSQMRKLRPEMQMIFQDVTASLNPRKTIREILEQPFKLHTSLSKKEISEEIFRLLESVGITPPQIFLDRYPHELSGGQRQRINIARAIALRPKLLIADEPVSALDTSIKRQIVDLLVKIHQEESKRLAYIIVSHDISLVHYMTRLLAVMYLGKIVEIGETKEIIMSPKHPYTQALIAAVPEPNPVIAKSKKLLALGEPPSTINPPSGCRFHPRCPLAMERCKKEEPPLMKINNRYVACWYYV